MLHFIEAKVGLACALVLNVLAMVNGAIGVKDILGVIVVSAIGTATGFITTMILKRIFKRFITDDNRDNETSGS